MGANDVPFFWFLDPGFWGFVILCGIGYFVYGIGKAVWEKITRKSS